MKAETLMPNVSKMKISSYLGIRVSKAHYKQMLNVEFDWDDSSLSIEPSFEDLAIKIAKNMVGEAVLKMKEGKACDLSGTVIEVVKAGGDGMVDITDLINLIIKEEQIPYDWDLSIIINCEGNKGKVMESDVTTIKI